MGQQINSMEAAIFPHFVGKPLLYLLLLAALAVFFLLFVGALLEMMGVYIIVPLVNVILQPESMLENQEWIWLWQMLRVENASGLVVVSSTTTIIRADIVSMIIVKILDVDAETPEIS